MASNTGKHLSISVKKFGDGKPVDVNDRSNQWSSYDDALRTALELAIQNHISGKANALDLPHVDVASKWLLQPKSLQISLEASNGYPSLLQNEDDDDVATCNQKRIAYSSWAQAALCAVLLESFQKSDPQIFKSHSILKSDAASLAKHPDHEGELGIIRWTIALHMPRTCTRR